MPLKNTLKHFKVFLKKHFEIPLFFPQNSNNSFGYLLLIFSH